MAKCSHPHPRQNFCFPGAFRGYKMGKWADCLTFHSKINPSMAGSNFHPILLCPLPSLPLLLTPCQQIQDKTRAFHWPLSTLARNGLNIKWYHSVTHFVYENELTLNPGSFYPFSHQVAMPLCAHHQNKKTEKNSKTP